MSLPNTFPKWAAARWLVAALFLTGTIAALLVWLQPAITSAQISDPTATLTVDRTDLVEGQEAVVTVTLKPAPTAATVVNFTVGGGDLPESSRASEDDYNVRGATSYADGTGTVTVAPPGLGDTSATARVRIVISNDFDDEGVEPEGLVVSLADGDGYALSSTNPTEATIRILDGVCDRSELVCVAIVDTIDVSAGCATVTQSDLDSIVTLDLPQPIPANDTVTTDLKSGDFQGLPNLRVLNMRNSLLNSLPDGLFEGVTDLHTVRMTGNRVPSFAITVSLVADGDTAFKLLVDKGAPFPFGWISTCPTRPPTGARQSRRRRRAHGGRLLKFPPGRRSLSALCC